MKAIDEIKSGKSYSKVSALYEIPIGTLFNHVSKKTKGTKAGPSHLLNQEEEFLLMDSIKKSSLRGCPRRRKDIIEDAHLLLKRRDNGHMKQPGAKWFSAFKKRNKLANRKSETLSKPSACLSRSNIESWFDRVHKYISRNDCPGDKDHSKILKDPSRCYNADESFFLLNPARGLVVVPKGTKNVYEIRDGSEKEGVTVMACFCADGTYVTPQVVFAYERVPANIRSSFPASLHLSYSKSGCMNSELFLEFIKYDNTKTWHECCGCFIYRRSLFSLRLGSSIGV